VLGKREREDCQMGEMVGPAMHAHMHLVRSGLNVAVPCNLSSTVGERRESMQTVTSGRLQSTSKHRLSKCHVPPCPHQGPWGTMHGRSTCVCRGDAGV
jgi:hypothetical protein